MNKQYKKHTTVLTKKIETSFTKFVTFVIQLEHFENITTPSWILIKLRNGGIPESESFVDNLLNLIIVEWGQTINVIEGQPSTFNLKRLNEDKNIFSNINNPEILEKGTIILEDENGNIVNILGLVNIKEKKNNSNLYLECSFYDIHNNPNFSKNYPLLSYSLWGLSLFYLYQISCVYLNEVKYHLMND